MFSWYRSQMREQGLGPATALFWRAAWSQVRARAANKLLAPRYECPCCGWTGRRFYDYLETGYRVRNAACPQCDSHGRHRLLYWWLQNEFDLAGRRGAGLMFAPERALAKLWQEAKGLRMYRLDIVATRGVDVLADAQRLPFRDGVFSLIWCHHVLEQVPDDRAALQELRRVLADEGLLAVSAGLHPRAVTLEFGFSDKRYSGNRRSYGQDFAGRLAETGLTVEKVACSLTAQQREHYGITTEEVFFLCRPTRRQHPN